MSKRTLIIAVAVAAVVIIGGGAAYMVFGRGDSSQNNTTSEETTPDPANNQQITGNVFSLAESSQARKCIFNYDGDKGKASGTIYSDGQGRGLLQMNIESERGNATSNTLVTKDKVYSWTTNDGKTVGFTADTSTFKNQNTSSQSSGTSTDGPTANQDFELDCADWTVDETVLAVPSDVNFATIPSGL